MILYPYNMSFVLYLLGNKQWQMQQIIKIKMGSSLPEFVCYQNWHSSTSLHRETRLTTAKNLP